MTAAVLPFRRPNPRDNYDESDLALLLAVEWAQDATWYLLRNADRVPSHSVRIALGTLEQAVAALEVWTDVNRTHFLPTEAARATSYQSLLDARTARRILEARRPPCPVVRLPLPKRRRRRQTG